VAASVPPTCALSTPIRALSKQTPQLRPVRPPRTPPVRGGHDGFPILAAATTRRPAFQPSIFTFEDEDNIVEYFSRSISARTALQPVRIPTATYASRAAHGEPPAPIAQRQHIQHDIQRWDGPARSLQNLAYNRHPEIYLEPLRGWSAWVSVRWLQLRRSAQETKGNSVVRSSAV
jgi:hypothetical protein